MDGDEEHQRRDHHRAGQRLPGVEAHRRPGRGWAAGMMHRMGDAKQLGPMHPAVRPVEPGVMGGEIEQHRQRQIPERHRRDIGVDARPAMRLPTPGDHARGHAVDERRGQRPGDFPPHLLFQAAIQAWLANPGRERKAPARQQIPHADNGAHRQGGQKNSCDHEAPIGAIARLRKREPAVKCGGVPADSCPAPAPIWCGTPVRRAPGRPPGRPASLRYRRKIRSRRSSPRADSFPAWSY